MTAQSRQELELQPVSQTGRPFQSESSTSQLPLYVGIEFDRADGKRRSGETSHAQLPPSAPGWTPATFHIDGGRALDLRQFSQPASYHAIGETNKIHRHARERQLTVNLVPGGIPEERWQITKTRAPRRNNSAEKSVAEHQGDKVNGHRSCFIARFESMNPKRSV